MADKSFGVKELNLISASGTPTITSPNSVNINATNVAISTDITVGGMVSLGAGTSISSPGSNVLTFGTNSTEKVRIDSAGRVMLGTTSVGPTAGEQLTIADSANAGITIRSGTTAAGTILFEDDTADRGEIQYSHNGDYMRFKTAGSERLRITSDGKMGLGETTPLGNLHVKSSDSGASVGASADEFVIESNANTGMSVLSGTSGQGLINFADSGDVNIGSILYDHSDNSMRVKTNDAEVLRVTSDGKMGVGTASPNHRLTLHQSGTSTFDALNITSGLTNAVGLQLGINSASNAFFWHTANGGIQFATNNVERMRITNNGITFNGDTSADNALDDYEEGNFTPIVRGRTTAGTASYGRTAVGKYTKVGRMVSVMVDMVFSSANGNGNVEIAGLPFAAHSGPYVRFAGDVTLLTAGLSWSNQIACYINDTNSHFWITNTPTSGNYSFVNINSNTTEILLHCTYMIS